MKSAEFLQKEINTLIETTSVNKQKISEVNKSKKLTDYERKQIRQLKAENKRNKLRQSFLKTCLLYINTQPKEDYLKSEAERISNRINLLLKDKDFNNNKKAKAEYEKEMGIVKIRKQLTTINFLLN